jgi:hypothetical protein
MQIRSVIAEASLLGRQLKYSVTMIDQEHYYSEENNQHCQFLNVTYVESIVMHLYEVSGSSEIDIGMRYGLTSFSIVHHFEER